MQTKDMYYRGISHALLTITRDEGVRGLYKGLGTTLMVSSPNLIHNKSIYVFIQSFLDYVTFSHGSWRGFKKVAFWKSLVVKENQAVVKSHTNLHGQCGVFQ